LTPWPSRSPARIYVSVWLFKLRDLSYHEEAVSGGLKLQKDNRPQWDLAVRLGTTDGTSSGHLVMTDGEIELNESSDGNSPHGYGMELYGTSTATISGGVLDVNEVNRGNAIGFTANDSSAFIMTDGSFFVDEADNNDLTGFVAADDSTVQISGGTIELTETGGGSLTTFVARDNATVDISGGDWSVSWTSRASHYNGFRSNDNARVTIYGSSPNYDLDEFITANTGTITGTLADGTPVDLKFDRSGGGQIFLSSPVSVAVPEPSTLVLSVLGLLAMALAGRRRR